MEKKRFLNNYTVKRSAGCVIYEMTELKIPFDDPDNDIDQIVQNIKCHSLIISNGNFLKDLLQKILVYNSAIRADSNSILRVNLNSIMIFFFKSK